MKGAHDACWLCCGNSEDHGRAESSFECLSIPFSTLHIPLPGSKNDCSCHPGLVWNRWRQAPRFSATGHSLVLVTTGGSLSRLPIRSTWRMFENSWCPGPDAHPRNYSIWTSLGKQTSLRISEFSHVCVSDLGLQHVVGGKQGAADTVHSPVLDCLSQQGVSTSPVLDTSLLSYHLILINSPLSGWFYTRGN